MARRREEGPETNGQNHMQEGTNDEKDIEVVSALSKRLLVSLMCLHPPPDLGHCDPMPAIALAIRMDFSHSGKNLRP